MKEFRGYLDGILRYTFPLNWVDEIISCYNGVMIVRYYNELEEENKECCTKITEIEVDYIDIK